MKHILLTTLFLFAFTTLTAQQKNISLPMYIKENFKKSTTYKKQLIDTYPKCQLDEVYFVEGFDKNKKLAERYIVFNEKGHYTKSDRFFFWAAYKHPVLYYHKSDSDETAIDLKSLKISFNKGTFTFTNRDLQKNNAEVQRKIEKGENISEEQISEASGKGTFRFKDYLDETECKK